MIDYTSFILLNTNTNTKGSQQQAIRNFSQKPKFSEIKETIMSKLTIIVEDKLSFSTMSLCDKVCCDMLLEVDSGKFIPKKLFFKVVIPRVLILSYIDLKKGDTIKQYSFCLIFADF